MTTEELRALIEVETTTSLWGQPRKVTPRLVEQILGDGKQLIWFAPIMSRPNWYVVRIDSGMVARQPPCRSGLRSGRLVRRSAAKPSKRSTATPTTTALTSAPAEAIARTADAHYFPALCDGGESWGPETLDDYRLPGEGGAE